MPVYESYAALASAAISIGASYASSQINKPKGGAGGVPSYNSQQGSRSAANIFNQAADQGISFAKRGTEANISNQEMVTPGSQAQRQAALNQINAYIQGQVPQDVQQNINRQVAQNLGGGFNLFSGGGQAPNAFARNIGQTSVGLSQYGLSAAPTWQELANRMVTKPEVGLQAGLQAAGLELQGAGLGMQNAENLYQSDFNQYKANQLQGQQNQLQSQQNQQLAMQLGQMGLNAYNSYQQGQYLNSLSPSGQGAAVTLGGLPSASTAGSYMSDLGYNPSSFTALPNTGGGTAYPFG
jgi:hypothetical protein